MILTQYDDQRHIENEKQWSYEEGERQGKNIISNLVLKLLQEGKQEEVRKALEDYSYQLRLLKEYDIE